eukprot:CAMPEP_0202700810 /NCGR_PEP_ID=MMETSP1385-20130828/13972_1 /ASSEMBLY_ACC=CAM_ASM_000861 /TAXON_ID=933848 /ORGANISM="Elphidium margaritaceum" /LENGTH=109 /DNA_ID=CAMNT_0049358081 /DNA_START=149 /DNA_END=478 /DNA_ORIENTATION=-
MSAENTDANNNDNNEQNENQSQQNKEHLNLKVKDQDGTEVYFKVKKTTKLKKLMDAYCARVGKEAGSIRFLFDGERIAQDATPNDLNMEDEDEIDAMVEQHGGHCSRSR